MKKRIIIATICGLLTGAFCITADVETKLAANVAQAVATSGNWRDTLQ